MSVTIYHNPRCSKSRQTLHLIEQRGIAPRVIEYLNHPPDADELRAILKKLGKRPDEVIRRKEAAEEGVAVDPSEPEALIAAMVAHPRIIERPIVVNGDRARLGRPPESVLEIL